MVPLTIGQSQKDTRDRDQVMRELAMKKQPMLKQSSSKFNICDNCNHPVWIRDRMESVFVTHPYFIAACYNQSSFIDVCLKKEKVYWVEQNLGYNGRAPYPHGDQTCPQYEKFFCFERDDNGHDPSIGIGGQALREKLKEKIKEEKGTKRNRRKEERIKGIG